MTDIKSEGCGGGGGKGGGGGRRNIFRANNYTHASKPDSQESEIDKLKTATYIMSQVFIAD